MLRIVFCLVVTLLFVANIWGQGIPYNQEFQVNTFTNRLVGHHVITALPLGGFVICWQSRIQDNPGLGIFGQLFDVDGYKKMGEFQVDSNTNSLIRSPVITALPDNRFVVCWVERFASSWWLYSQLFDNDGQKLGKELQITYHNNSFFDMKQAITALSDGFIIYWQNDIRDMSGLNIFGQLFDTTGQKKGSEFLINTYTDRNQGSPVLSTLSNGKFVVCWESYGQDGSGYGIFGQIFDSAANKIKNEFQVNTNTNGNQRYPVLASLPNGGFFICWINENQDNSGWDIFGQMFDGAGNKKGLEFMVNTYIDNDQFSPAIATFPDGGFLIYWHSVNQGNSGWDIFGQMFNTAGNKKGIEFMVNTYTTSYRKDLPMIGISPNGDFLICWESYRKDGSLISIFGQLFDSAGHKKGTEFQINTYTNNHQNYPVITTLTNGKFAICWQNYDPNDSHFGIFGKYLLTEPIIHQLSNFSIIEPSHDATLKSIRPTFKWHQVSEIRKCYPWEITYDLYIDTDINFINPRITTDIQDTTYRIDSLAVDKTYFWKVLAKNIEGDSLWSSETWGFYIKPDAIAVEDKNIKKIPNEFQLYQNYPNPFNSNTQIKYSIPINIQSTYVVIKIFDVLGCLIKVLVDKEQSSGTHFVVWDGTNMSENRVTSGIYFYTIEIEQFKMTKKILFLQ